MTRWIVSSSALILAVALLRRALRGRISPRLQYALWGLVLLRLLLPVQLGSSGLSVDNLTRQLEEQEAVQIVSALSQLDLPRRTYGAVYDEVAAEYAQKGVDISEMTTKQYENVDYEIRYRMRGDLSFADLIRWGWILGGAGLLGVFLVCSLRFSRQLRRSGRRLNVDAPLPVYLSPVVDTPCLFGLFRPAVCLTPEAAADETMLRHALAHELTHFAHRDHVWTILRCLCLALHWYNPLVWLAARLSTRDGELACDADTLRRLGDDERIAYGKTLIDLTCGKRTSLLYTATTMGADKKQLKERITLIAKRPKMLAVTGVAVALIAAAAVWCTFTGGRDTVQKPAADPVTSALVVTGSPAPQGDGADALASEATSPDGVVRLCEPVGDEQYLLLYSTPVEHERCTGSQDVFYLYDREKRTFQLVFQGEDLYKGPEHQVAVTEDKIIYQYDMSNYSQILTLTKEGSAWEPDVAIKLTRHPAPYLISPDGSTYAAWVWEDGAVKLMSLADDTVLEEKQLEAITGMYWKSMQWSGDGTRLVLPWNNGGATVWDMEEDSVYTFEPDWKAKNPQVPYTQDIHAWPVGEDFLLVLYQRTASRNAMVIMDVRKDALSDSFELRGEIHVLDVCGDVILYEVAPEEGAHTLNTYNCATKERRELDRCLGVYTAGAMSAPDAQPLVFRYETGSDGTVLTGKDEDPVAERSVK